MSGSSVFILLKVRELLFQWAWGSGVFADSEDYLSLKLGEKPKR